MSIRNLFRSLMTHSLSRPRATSIRKPLRHFGRRIEELEDRTTPSLLNYYPADGNANDVQSGNNGVIHNNVTFVPGVFGQASRFRWNQQLQRLIQPRQISTDFTINAWIKTTAPGGGSQYYNGNPVITAEVAGVTNDFGTSINSGGKFGFGVGAPDQTIQSTTSVNDGNWHMVTAVRSTSTSTISVYVDGVLENSLITADNGPLTASPDITIGGDIVNNLYFPGLVDDVRIYNSALTSVQVQALDQPPNPLGRASMCLGEPSGHRYYWCE